MHMLGKQNDWKGQTGNCTNTKEMPSSLTRCVLKGKKFGVSVCDGVIGFDGPSAEI